MSPRLTSRIAESFWRSNPRPDARVVDEMRLADAPDARPVARHGREGIAFIEKLARALHRYGSAAPTVEDALALVAERLGIHGEFFATPTAIFASLDTGDIDQTIMIRVEPGSVNLDKLSRLDRLTQDVADGRVSPAEASRIIDEIRATPPRFRGKTTAIAFAVASAASACFFGGGWREMVACSAIGLVSGLLALLARRNPRFRLFEPLAAFIGGFGAYAAAALMPPTSLYVAMAGGLIVLLPGLTLTTAISELATRHLQSGTSRLMSALIILVSIGFGVALGLEAGERLFGSVPVVNPEALPPWTLAIAVVMASLAFMVLNQAHYGDGGWILLVCVLAFVGSRLGAQWIGVESGAFLGAVLVGVTSGIISHARNRPAIVTATPGTIMLVPGSIGFRSITEMIANDPVSGLHTAFTMILTGVALATGLLVARLIVPRRSLFK
ncbi:MAG TPA: threonine/serine exporter family protein [Candidatus Krumholzibacteria bacterium]|nr:threonine/serine exporter family protein [Candidatus Krumholzibacteria bacterium]